jgi:uncharacterized protein YecT (DUF1311 family)
MKIRSLIVLVPLCAVIFATELQKEGLDIDAQIDEFRSRKDQLPNTGLARLAFLEYQKADRELNIVYEVALDAISKSGIPDYGVGQWLEQQRSAQRAWIKFRDEDSRVVDYIHWGGSGAGIFNFEWKTKLTQTRTQQLRDWYHIEEVKRDKSWEPAGSSDALYTAPES